MSKDKNKEEQKPVVEELSDPEDMEVKILMIVKDYQKQTKVGSFLQRRGWPTVVTKNLGEAIQVLTESVPDFIIVSMSHSSPKITKFPLILAQTFNAKVVVFGEDFEPKTKKKLNTSRCPYVMHEGMSGPSLQRRIKKIILDSRKTHDESSPKVGLGLNSDGSGNINVKGGSQLSGDGNATVQKGGLAYMPDHSNADSQDSASKIANLMKMLDSDNDGAGSLGYGSGESGQSKKSNGRGPNFPTDEGSNSSSSPQAGGFGGTNNSNQSENSLSFDKNSNNKAQFNLKGNEGPSGTNGEGGSLGYDFEKSKPGKFGSSAGSKNKFPLSDEEQARGAKGLGLQASTTEGASGRVIIEESVGGSGKRFGIEQGGDNTNHTAMSTKDSVDGINDASGAKGSEGRSGSFGDGTGSGEISSKDKNSKNELGVDNKSEPPPLNQVAGTGPGTGTRDSSKQAPENKKEDLIPFIKDRISNSMREMKNKEKIEDDKKKTQLYKSIEIAMKKSCEPGQVINKKIGVINKVWLVLLKSDSTTGYLTVAVPYDGMDIFDYLNNFRSTLTQELTFRNIRIFVDTVMKASIKDVDYVHWIDSDADFSFVNQHKDYEVGVSFIQNDDVILDEGSAFKGKAPVKVEQIIPNEALQFPAYIFLERNNKYYKYLKRGRKLLHKQKDRLLKNEVSDLHIDIKDFELYKTYHAENALNSMIANYKEDEMQEAA